MPPLGILYLSAWLRKHGHEVSIVDLAGVDDWETEVFKNWVDLELADIIGFTATTPQYNISQKIMNYIIDVLEINKKFVIGGIHTTSLAYANEMDFLEKDGFDSYCIGEGYNSVIRMADDFPNLKRMYSEPILKDVNELTVRCQRPDRYQELQIQVGRYPNNYFLFPVWMLLRMYLL